MKFNKWTVGLAAVGAVSFASVAQAEEHAVMTAFANTTISGYVDTSAQWNVGNDTANFAPYSFGGAGKADGFNLNVVKLSIERPLDEATWAAGYKVDLLFGPDAVAYNTSANSGVTADFGVKQAYVALRAPVGNGLDFKIGTFDTILGYEVFEAGNNPNFTRSYGYTIEPTQHTGLLASYKVCDVLALSAGVANTLTAGINARSPKQTSKTYMGSFALSAPESWGWFAGSTLYAGFVDGFAGNATARDTVNYYAGAVLKTPVTGLTFGLAWDHVSNSPFTGGGGTESASVYGIYASFQATEKLSFHARGELADEVILDNAVNYGVTLTAQYDLWQNVVSRLEFRWDGAQHAAFGGDATQGVPPQGNPGPTESDAYVLIANFVYKF